VEITSCTTGKNDAALLEGCVSYVELIIILTATGYRIVLKRDGVVMERKVFDTEEQVLSWANAIMDLVGENLYIKLFSNGGHSCHELLELASILSRQGILVGVNNLRFICRLPNTHLE